MDSYDGQPPRVVETASGTTDANNSKSGGLAYVIAAIALVASFGLGVGLKGCMNVTANMLGSSYGTQHDGEPQWLDDRDDSLNDLDDLDKLFGDEGSGDGGLGGDTLGDTDSSASQPVADLLGGDLKMYGYTIDSRLGASAYANAQQSVSSYARELVVLDRDASSEIATTLHNAAWGSGKLADALDAASQKASETIEALRALEVPTAEGAQAQGIAEDLADAREEAIERWEAISSELALMARSETLSADDLASYERSVTEATDDAAEDLADALKASTDR